MISVYYLGSYEVKMKEDMAREKFLADLTKLMLEGDLSGEAFRRMEPVVKYGRTLQLDGVDDGLLISLLGWIRCGALDDGWSIQNLDCPRCSGRATSFVASRAACSPSAPPSQATDLRPEPRTAGPAPEGPLAVPSVRKSRAIMVRWPERRRRDLPRDIGQARKDGPSP